MAEANTNAAQPSSGRVSYEVWQMLHVVHRRAEFSHLTWSAFITEMFVQGLTDFGRQDDLSAALRSALEHVQNERKTLTPGATKAQADAINIMSTGANQKPEKIVALSIARGYLIAR